MQTVREGAAKIKVSNGVFYNPKMGKLRDISVLFLKSLGLKKTSLLDSTAATGIRGIRYVLEAGVKNTTFLDINKMAARNVKANVKLNGLKPRVLDKSLQEFAGSYEEAFNVIDIDPFGTPVPMIKDALRLSTDGTILMITATDTATLCGAEGDACLRIYASRPIHNELCHEAGIRILINFIAREAAQFNFGIEPLLSIADMHYFRVFLRLKRGAKEAAGSIKECGFGAYCSNCHNFALRKGVTSRIDDACGNCGKKMYIFGPLWLGNLQEKSTLEKMLKLGKSYSKESIELVRKIDEELDIPFFYSIPKMTSYLGIGSIPFNSVLAGIAKKGRVSRTHFEKDCIKTTATTAEVISAVRQLEKHK